ncbi:hypothetical protein J3R82DRAFT_11188 [Butyriboletus roseoflavus]|nr:hypothetical protein J3R82DRAFT_11188 [Butyriboletus roseoflavus]
MGRCHSPHIHKWHANYPPCRTCFRSVSSTERDARFDGVVLIGTIKHVQLAAIKHNRQVVARFRGMTKTPGETTASESFLPFWKVDCKLADDVTQNNTMPGILMRPTLLKVHGKLRHYRSNLWD